MCVSYQVYTMMVDGTFVCAYQAMATTNIYKFSGAQIRREIMRNQRERNDSLESTNK